MMQKPTLPLRLSRTRRSEVSRNLVRETSLGKEKLIAPLFISATLKNKKEIPSMPGQYQFSLNDLHQEIESLSEVGIQAVLLFGIPEYKDSLGSACNLEEGIIQKAIRIIKQTNPDMLVISDLCFCEYTDHGHCGALQDSFIDTDKTLDLLGQQALSHARAGADWIAPSGMVDGMVQSIREALDSEGFTQIPILSYSVKYCSCLYGPFREAAQGAPQFGDRKSYQMDPANSLEALREAELDICEGADLLMVKPAGFYLDIIYQIKQTFPQIPLCAYQVSGEYSMLKAAAKQGLIDEKQAMLESLISIKRAGADFIISYFAKEYAKVCLK